MPAQWEMVNEQTCRAVVALSTCGSRSMRAREAVSVRGGCAADLRGSPLRIATMTHATNATCIRCTDLSVEHLNVNFEFQR